MNASQIIFPIIAVFTLLSTIGIGIVFTFFPRQSAKFMVDHYERINVYGTKPLFDPRGEWYVVAVRIFGVLMLLMICCSSLLLLRELFRVAL